MRHRLLLLAAFLLPTALACEAPVDESGTSCAGGKCDDPREGVDDGELVAFPCDGAFENFSSRRNPDGSEITRFVDRLRDPLTALAFRGDECPTTYADIIEAMKANDTDCDTISGDEHGLATRLVSEDVQLQAPPSIGFRAVTTKSCGPRLESDLFFSVFDLNAESSALPTRDVEIIARDEQSGAYNFYREVDGKMGFFGSGLDYLFDGHGDSVTDINGCGSCHAGNAAKSGRGNLNMKELATPWMHWEGSFPRNGGDEIIARFASSMGKSQGGANMESLVERGNALNSGVVISALLAARDYKRLLGPLFCSEQLNVATGDRERVPSGFLYNQLIHRDEPVRVDEAGYEALLAATGSSIIGSPTDKDTEFPFAYIARSGDDQGYVAELIKRGIIDLPFALDVLAVDFTRPALSDARCDLLELAPTSADLSEGDINAASVASVFLRNAAGASGTAAAQLRAHLEATAEGASFDHRARARAFTRACQAESDDGAPIAIDIGGGQTRMVSRFQLSAMKLRSRDVHLALAFDTELNDSAGSDRRPRPVFEFVRTFAADKIRVTAGAAADDVLAVHPDAYLSPIDCTLVTELVAVPKPLNP